MSMVWTIASLLTYNERIYEHSNPLRIEDFIPQVPSIMMVAIRGVRIDWKCNPIDDKLSQVTVTKLELTWLRNQNY